MWKSTTCAAMLWTCWLLASTTPGRAQLTVPADAPLELTLQPNQTQKLTVAGTPQSLQVVEIRLGGGLVAVQSAAAVRRVLDLGRGGRLPFAVRIPENGLAELDVSSSERLRSAGLSLQLATGKFSSEQQQHLLAAGIAFAQADTTRRRQPQAPSADAALKSYDLAIREYQAAGSTSLARSAMVQKARLQLFQQSSFAATRLLLLSAAALPAGEDPAGEAAVYKTLSSCEHFLGDMSAAIDDSQKALALYRQTGDIYWQGIVLGNLIADYGELGRSEEAAAAAREALADAEQTQDTVGVVFCLTELATLYRQSGALQSAFDAFEQAKTWTEDIRFAPLVQADFEEALGRFYVELGLWPEAQEQLELCILHSPANSPTLLEARGLLARAREHRGDLRGALREFDTGIGSAAKSSLPSEEAQLLLGRSATLLHAHQPAAALQDARRAAQLAEEQNLPILRIDAALAEASACLRSCPKPQDAALIYRKALQWIAETGVREQEAAAFAGLAQVDQLLGNEETALQEIDHSLTLLEHSRAAFTSHSITANYLAERADWYRQATDLCVELDNRHPGQGFGEKAFQYTEHARARAMLDTLGDAYTSSASAKLPESLSHRLAENSRRIEAQKQKLLNDADPHIAAAALHGLYREQDALEAEERTQLRGAASPDITGIASTSRVQNALLAPDTALLSFAPGQHASFRWLITHQAVHRDTLPAADEIDRQVEALRSVLAARRPAPHPGEDVGQFLTRLSAYKADRELRLRQVGTLLLPAIPRSVHRLYIVADGSLLSLPWGALRITQDGREAYALEHYAIALEPSASVAVALATGRPLQDRSKVLVVSDPVPNKQQATPRWLALGLLPGSRQEAQEMAARIPRADLLPLRGPAATVQHVREALDDQVATLHFAAHTVLIPGHPEFSGIALSPGTQGSASDSGVLWLHDIPHLHAPPLVVLSGCSTQGSSFAGEELDTLAQAFFYAGSQQVVASAWAVDDEATVPLMRAFYENLLHAKMPAADALRKAQLRRMAEGKDLADWAPFLIDGVPARTVATENARR